MGMQKTKLGQTFSKARVITDVSLKGPR